MEMCLPKGLGLQIGDHVFIQIIAFAAFTNQKPGVVQFSDVDLLQAYQIGQVAGIGFFRVLVDLQRQFVGQISQHVTVFDKVLALLEPLGFKRGVSRLPVKICDQGVQGVDAV
ncbi:hypothetical protein D3C80_1788460 [compost metagenome]